jgi:hypothetical protein
MPVSDSLELTLLPGARALLDLHARDLPQRDDLCGAFCVSLALRAALAVSPGVDQDAVSPEVDQDAVSPGVDQDAGAVDQDAVALAAGTVISREPDPSILPAGETGRRDYRLSLPSIEDSALSGTTAAGLIAAVDRLTDKRLAAIPYAGPWTPATLDGLFDLLAARPGPAAMVANLATRHLWGSHPHPDSLLAYLLDGPTDGPPPDWDVGHFVCVVGRVDGPRGSLYAVADTYPSLGSAGVHVQPRERLAAAIDRRDKPAGGVLAVVAAADAPAVRAGAAELGLVEGVWDNGTPESELAS